MITKNIQNKIKKTIITQIDDFKKTDTILKNRCELLKNKKNIISIKKKNKTNVNRNKMQMASEYFFYQSKMLKDQKNTIILKKIQEIDPWYRKICQLKKLPKIVKKLAIHTSYKKTSKYWYVFLDEKNKHLIKYNTWNTFKKELHTITEKKIQLIIYKKNILKILTPYKWFKKIYKEKIFREYLLLIKDPNVQFLKQYFHTELDKKDIILTL